MGNSKFVLLIDGNWLLMSRLSVVINKLKYLDNNEFKSNLKLLLTKSIKIVLKTFVKIDNIIVVSDGGSWRQSLEIPKCMKHDELGKAVEYKGTRVYDDTIDWEFIWETYEEFLNDLRMSGVNVCYHSGIEGDDWCWYVSRELNKNNINCMIWSTDKDLTQLVKVDNNKCFTVWWNQRNGCYIEDYKEENIDFLFNINYSDNDVLLSNIINNSVSFNKIKPTDIVLEKILLGDGSDNIFPVVLRKAKNKASTKKFKLTKKDIDYSLDYNDKNKVDNYLFEIENNKKYKDLLVYNHTDMMEHFEYNKKLVSLSEESYPEHVITEMQENFTIPHNENVANVILDLESKYFAETNKISSVLDII